MLISQDVIRFLDKFVEPPAQLCLIRVLGSDHEFFFRVRYKDTHFDVPFRTPLLDTSYAVAQAVDWNALGGKLHAMSMMVVPPEARTQPDRNWNSHPEPAILAPMSPGKFRYEW